MLDRADLSHNEICNYGALGLTNVLISNVTLRFLNLGSCGLHIHLHTQLCTDI